MGYELPALHSELCKYLNWRIKLKERIYNFLIKAWSDSLWRPRIHELPFSFPASSIELTGQISRAMAHWRILLWISSLLFPILLDVLLEGFKLLIKRISFQSGRLKFEYSFIHYFKCDLGQVTKPLQCSIFSSVSNSNNTITIRGIVIIPILEGYRGW